MTIRQNLAKKIAILGCFIAIHLLFSVPDGVADDKVVRLTNGEWPPYTSQSLENYGPLSQIIQEAFALEGYRVIFGFYPWKRSFELAKEGDWDGTAPWQITKAWEKEFYISDPVVDSAVFFYHRTDDQFDWRNLQDLKGMTIGTTFGYAYSPTFRSESKTIDLNLVDSYSDLINLRLLQNRRIDLHPIDYRVAQFLIRKYFSQEHAKLFTYHQKPLGIQPLFVLFHKQKPGNAKRRMAFNRGLKKLKKSGRYQQIISRIQGEKQLTVALAHWPPWKIVDKDYFGGIDVEILKELGRRTGVTYSYLACPWKRCVEMARQGNIDLITSFGRNRERESFAHFLGPPYKSDKMVFYKKKNKPFKVSAYRDLYRFKIGSMRGSTYFKRFDDDKRLDRINVALNTQLPEMLFNDRIDLMIGFEIPTDYFIRSQGYKGQFEKLNFRIDGAPAFFAMPKLSNKMQYMDLLTTEIGKMVQEGKNDRIIQKYLNQILPERSIIN